MANKNLETTAAYKLRKVTISVERIFQTKDAETIKDIIIRLLKREIENG